MKKQKKRIIVGVCASVCVVCVGTGIFLSQRGGSKDTAQMAYMTSVSSMNQIAGTQKMAGVVESQQTLDIQKDAEREIQEIFVKPGDDVEVGAKLFAYDTESVEADLQQAKLDLERKDNEMANLKTQIQQLEKEKKKVSQDEKFSYTTQIQTAEMDLKRSEYEKKAKEVEINRLQSKIENSVVTSEMKGVVKSVNSAGSQDGMNMYDGSSQAFITILATGEYRIKGKVNEQNVSQIMEGETAVIRSRVNEEMVWKGVYTAVDTQNPENNNNNMYYGGMSMDDSAQTMSSSYPFYVELDSSEGLLLGQHVYIEKESGAEKREEGVWLDEAFIVDLDTKPYVWAETAKGTLEKRELVLGSYDEMMMQYKVEDGLEKSDYVAFPQEFFKEGMKTAHEMSEEMPEDMPEFSEDAEAMPEV